jgi:hypothetical protein
VDEPVVEGGFTVLDGAALVIGAAVASVHIRGSVPTQSLGAFGWSMLWVTLGGVALTAAGPFVFLMRLYWRRPPGYPRMGDWLWLMLGLPWVATTVLRRGASASLSSAPAGTLYTSALGLGTLAASMAALAVVWRAWVMVPAERLAQRGPSPWTDRVGLILAVAWPLQCGFVMVVGSH